MNLRTLVRRLSLAATPTFAGMALVTGVFCSARPDGLCSAAGTVSPLSGMVVMYLLMSVFHLPPWLRLVSSRRRRGAGLAETGAPSRPSPTLDDASIS
jgi:hypothetical protein